MTTFLHTTSPLSGLVPVGGAWVLDVSTTDENGDHTSAVVPVVSVTDPAGAITTPAPVAGVTGFYTITVTPVLPGRYVAHLSTPDDALDAATYVLGPTTAAGMPNVSDVAAYLGQYAGSWSTVDMQDALDAERGAQRDRCGERPHYPPQLRQALLRRVQRNLAMRRAPLAVTAGDADGSVTILPGKDPEVRRLEGPYRRLVIG